MLRLPVALLTLALPSVGWSQSCPQNVDRDAIIASGVPVTIRAIDTDDAYSGDTSLLGASGVSNGLRIDSDCWYGGQVTLNNGETYYFYRVAVDAAGQSQPMPTCSDRSMRDVVRRGDVVMVDTVHPDDSYFSSPELRSGSVLTAQSDLTITEDCWYSGSVSDPATSMTYYLYKVSLVRDKDQCPSNALRSLPPSGSVVAIAAVHEDAPAADVERLHIGDTVTLTDQGGLSDECWFSGPVDLADGTTHQASRIAVRRSDTSRRTCPSQVTVPVAGQAVIVGGVHRSDPYASVTSQIQGLTGSFSTVVQSSDGCWVGGDFRSDTGVRYRFSAVDVMETSSP